MIKILIIDDSMIVRRLLTKIINNNKNFTVVASVANPYKAVEIMRTEEIDVITLDVEMPRMNGIEFMKKLNNFGNFKVLMISSLTEKGAKVTMEALSNGAIDYVFKPKSGSKDVMRLYEEEITEKISACYASGSSSKMKLLEEMNSSVANSDSGMAIEPNSADVILPFKNKAKLATTSSKIIAIGSSTGGTEAIKDILYGLDGNAPGIVIAQHMPKDFTKAFADRLNRLNRVNVKEAEDGDLIVPGHVYIAPGDLHLTVKRIKDNYICKLIDGDPVKRHKPSCDVLLRSVANEAGHNAIGMILTGMGSDGAKGLLEMKQRGSRTIAQSKADCVVFGMPREAIKIGAAMKESTLRQMPENIMDYLIDMEKE